MRTDTDFRTGLGATAIHEASHAIAGFHSRELPRVGWVSLGLSGIPQPGGACTTLRELDAVRLSEAAFREGMRALVAGFIGEALAGGRRYYAGGDADKIVRLVALRASWRLGRARFSNHRSALLRVDAELRASERIARDAARDAEVLLRLRWHEVEGVARRLLEVGDLDAKLLATTIERTQRRPAPKVGDVERLLGLFGAFESRHVELEAALRQQLALA